MKGEGTGDGAVDALLQAINAATGIAGVLKEYHVAAVTADTDALGEVSVLVEHEGRLVSGQSVSTDTLEASARAYLRALSNALAGVSASPAVAVGGGGRSTPIDDFDFIWRDGERVIRFGVGALAEAPELLAASGFKNYALLTTERAAGPRFRRSPRTHTSSRTCRTGRCPRPRPRFGSGSTTGRWWRSAAAA